MDATTDRITEALVREEARLQVEQRVATILGAALAEAGIKAEDNGNDDLAFAITQEEDRVHTRWLAARKSWKDVVAQLARNTVEGNTR